MPPPAPSAAAAFPLALLEESAEDLYENAPCGYISTLPDGTIARVNQTFLAWTGYTREELVGVRRFQDLLTAGGRIFHETHLAPLLHMQGFVNEVNLDVVCQGGSVLPALTNTVMKADASGQPLLHRATIFNITDRKRYERELRLARDRAEQAARAKADFLSLVSHEIRTPMSAILGAAGLLQRTALTPQQQRYVRILQSSSDNLLALLDNILDFSKVEAGKVALEARPLDVRQLVYGTLFALSGRAEEKRLALEAHVDEAVPAHVVGDPVKLGQVLNNLVGNAIKFTERGRVAVEVRLRERTQTSALLEVRVTDTGIGIPPERLASVFEEFTQAGPDIALKYGGTGLGLAICRKLLALHGSRLEVESRLGEGSTFHFALRAEVAEVAEAAEACGGPGADPTLDVGAVAGARVLVAEDNAINVFMLCQLLEAWGVSHVVVGDGRAALARVQQEHYDAVLMDLRMPGLDGYAATRAIRALGDPRLARLPVLALTASSRLGLEERVAEAGFTDVLGKPFRPAELHAKLAALLAAGRAAR